MLARLTTAKTSAPDFAALLRSQSGRPLSARQRQPSRRPPQPARKVERRRVEAGQRLASPALRSAANSLSTTLTPSAPQPVEPLFAAEAEARAHRDQLRRAYERDHTAGTGRPVQSVPRRHRCSARPTRRAAGRRGEGDLVGLRPQAQASGLRPQGWARREAARYAVTISSANALMVRALE